MNTIETIYRRHMLLNSAAVAMRRAASGDYPENSTENPPMCFTKVPVTDLRWRLMRPGWLRRLRLSASPGGMLVIAEEDGCHHPPLRLDPRMSSEKSPRAFFGSAPAWVGVVIRLLHDKSIDCSKVTAPYCMDTPELHAHA